MIEGISVVMPTYNQSSFILRAIQSVKKQTFKQWELIIVNDGCTDDTELILSSFQSDHRIKYIKINKNTGLGKAINKGIEEAQYDCIAYLPSDDYYYNDHLETIKNEFEKDSNTFLVFSGVRYLLNDTQYSYPKVEDLFIRNNYPLQLVQVAHKKSVKRWIEREDFVTDDLFRMYWQSLLKEGFFSFTKKITCFWTQHPYQRHRLINESFGGGLNSYRSFYNIREPIKIRISEYKFIDENKLYKPFRKRVTLSNKPLKILLVGELAFNPERIFAIEEAGHKLYGLWISSPSTFNTVGPLPYGNVEDIPINNYQEKITDIKPDIIYALLNFKAVPLAYEVLKNNPHIPFVWHFKEGPNFCLQQGTWDKLIYLYKKSHGKIYINETAKQWYEQFFIPEGLSFILDGDLPKKDYFYNDFTSKLSMYDKSIHTLVAGRMIGITSFDFKYLASQNIHIHLYSENYFKSRESQINIFKNIDSEHFHVHSHCGQLDWVKEFSKYDAGWLHSFESFNDGCLTRASWDDLNIPAKISTYAAAGIPVIMRNNKNGIVAIQKRIKELDIGILFNSYEELVKTLKDQRRMTKLTNNMLSKRDLFTFDYYVPELISFFRKVIKYTTNENNG